MKMLNVNDSTRVVCTISTVNGPVPDSDVCFYTTEWQELSASSFLQMPVLEDFLSVPDSLNDNGVQQAMSQADMTLVMANLSSKNDTLTPAIWTARRMKC